MDPMTVQDLRDKGLISPGSHVLCVSADGVTYKPGNVYRVTDDLGVYDEFHYSADSTGSSCNYTSSTFVPFDPGKVVSKVDGLGISRGNVYRVLGVAHPNHIKIVSDMLEARWERVSDFDIFNISDIFKDPEPSSNPKDAIGTKKPPFHLAPMSAVMMMNQAMVDGAEKYGPYNWREHPVRAEVYYNAAMRHLNQWFHGENKARDSGVHHLAHAMACLAIIIDAELEGSLIDNRPAHKVPLDTIVEQFTKV